ncbi:MAG: hypothetical protein K8L99_27470 [Anaerolineae bacterium]|nr:hypothetical protein [Anaerolineae bacterium]
MKHCFLFIVLAAAVLLILSLAVPLAAQDEAVPPQVGLRPDAPTYALHGPYWVGIKDSPITFEYRDGTKRESRVTVWYPSLNPDGKLEPFSYPSERRIRDFGGYLFFPRTGQALLDAAPNLEGAPYPLVIYSHGGWGYRWFNLEYAEHLASHGFVVLSTDHEDVAPAGFMPAHAELSRQWDISALIDYAAQINAPEGILAGMVDTARIGVTGYSAGGFTALLAGGARRNSQEKRTWCATDETKQSWVGPLLCGDEDSGDQQWAALLGVEIPPDGLWPDIGDKRVDAIVPLDGGAFDFGPDGLSQIRVPALLMFARGAPDAMPYPLDTLFASMKGKQEAIAIFENSDHQLFMQDCMGTLSADTTAICAEPVWDKDRAHDLINHLATAFLLDVLKGDKDAHAALLPDAVSFSGITYETTLE